LGSFPGVSLKLNGFSTAPANELIKNRARNARTGTRMFWIKMARPAVEPYQLLDDEDE